jgi:predicted transcriptional regulator
MARKKAALSDSELEVLKALWEDGSGTVRAVNDRLAAKGRTWAYTTVQTLLGRLAAKGCVLPDRRGLPHVYHAAVSRDDFLKARLDRLAADVCDGASTPLVRALVEAGRFTAADIRHFRRLLNELEKAAPDAGEAAPKRSRHR